MKYIKGETYLVTYKEPIELKTAANDFSETVTTLPPGHGVYCKSYTIDNTNDVWIREMNGWVRATRGHIIYIM